MDRALRLAAVIDTMREGSLFELDMFLQAAERGLGGKVVISTASDRQKRGNAEAQFVSEKIVLQGL
jgi:hypothetical protein